MRCLANSRKSELLDLVSLFDLPWPDTASVVRVARPLGVLVKIYTSDSAAVAKSDTSRIGVDADILHAEFIDVGEDIPTSEITAHIEVANAYAELDPGHKEGSFGLSRAMVIWSQRQVTGREMCQYYEEQTVPLLLKVRWGELAPDVVFPEFHPSKEGIEEQYWKREAQ